MKNKSDEVAWHFFQYIIVPHQINDENDKKHIEL